MSIAARNIIRGLGQPRWILAALSWVVLLAASLIIITQCASQTRADLAVHIAALTAVLAFYAARLRTERRCAAARLQLAEKIFEQSREAIMVTDHHKRVVAVNQAFVDMTGFPPHEVIGENPRIWKSGRQDDDFYKAMHEAMERDGHWQGEVWNRRKNGETYPEWVSISAIKGTKGRITNYLKISTDITERKRNEARLSFLANYDPLTGLPNRSLFDQRLRSELGRAHRYQKTLALFFIDLDRFKVVNDTLGHDAGDTLLKEAAERLKGCLRDSDAVARLGGDEFVAVIPEVTDAHDVTSVAQKILDQFSAPFRLPGNVCHVSASIGISCFPQDGAEPTDLLKHADVAMYRAKELGKNNFQFYSPSLNKHSVERLALEADLRCALEREEFRLQYQPKIDVRSGQVVGFEALIRWRSPERGDVPPSQFIPLAEETGLIVPIGKWVLKRACLQMRTWRQQRLPSMRVAVNLSAGQLRQDDFIPEVEQALGQARLDAGLLELEITESMVMQNPDHAARQLGALRSMGIHLSLDDFGTGYASLGHLKKFPIDTVKIDRSFIQDLPADPDSVAITRAIIAMAHSLRISVVAEGVEKLEQFDFLREHGCDAVQGYYFSKPLDAVDLAAFLRKHGPPGRSAPVRELAEEGIR